METENKTNYDLGEKSEDLKYKPVSCPTAITIKDEGGLERNVDLLGDLGC